MKSTRSAENKIKTARLAAGMTQAEMSEKYGIPIDTIKAWDCGRSYPQEWAETLLLEKLQEENIMRKKLENMYGDLDRFPTYDVITANGTTLKSATIIGNDECMDVNGFFQYALADDGKLYKAYYNLPECDDIDMAFEMIDYSKPVILMDVTAAFS